MATNRMIIHFDMATTYTNIDTYYPKALHE